MFGASGPAAACECGPNADWFVQEFFNDCIYTTWDLAAFWIGMSSVLFWIVAQLPQFISNWKNQTAEALSPWFLLQWLAGDSFNLLGCMLTGDQLATQTFTATYFIFADCVILSQYMYYKMRETTSLASDDKDLASSSLVSGYSDFSDFQKRLPKLTIAAPDFNEDLGLRQDAQGAGLYCHPVTPAPVTGRSGASMISHTTNSPQALSQDSAAASRACSPERGRPEGSSFQLNPDEEPHVKYVTGRSGASISHVVHSTISPHHPDVHQITKALQTMTLSSNASRAGRDRWMDTGLRVNHNVRRQLSGTSKRVVEDFLERPDRTDQFQSIEERNQSLARDRVSAALLGKIPQISLERLFRSENAMKRHLRRLVNQYDLECSPPSAPRLRIHHATSLGKHTVGKQMERTLAPKLGSQLNRRPIKAAACLASLLTVKTSTNYFQNSGTSGAGMSISAVSATVGIGRKLLLVCDEIQRPWWLKSVGNCFGWGSSALYFSSRFSQIAMNFQRRSAEGLSLAMLSCAILANTCMGLSIIMRTKSAEDLVNKAPWLLGSMGTITLDIFILLQAKYLDARSTKLAQTVPDERTHLLA